MITVSTTEYVDVDVDVEIDQEVINSLSGKQRKELLEMIQKAEALGESDFIDVQDVGHSMIERAYLAMTDQTPEPIRALILELTGRIV